MERQLIRFILLTAVIVFLTSCGSSSHIIIGITRDPIEPEKVKIYADPPAKHQKIAIVEASSKNSWAATDQGKTDKMIERLKGEAASLGANGILLQGVDDQNLGMVGSGFGSATAYSKGNVTNAYGAGSTVYVPAKNPFFCYGEVFFLDGCPLMGDPY